VEWAYGITTVPERFGDLLPKTIASLSAGGFDKPRLFIDGGQPYPDTSLAQTLRGERIKTFGNWWLSASELNLRYPKADRYALFQDDIVVYRNLRQYLERCSYPARGYLNCYTVPTNDLPGVTGWVLAKQLGKGACALIFDGETLRNLLSQRYLIDRMQSDRGWKSIDGGIVSAFRRLNVREYVHQPTLIQHTGKVSMMENLQHPLPRSFRGEDFDCMKLLKK
jgi:hypothetical protein